MRRQPPGDVAGNLQLAALWHQPKMAPRVLHTARYLGVPRIRSSMLVERFGLFTLIVLGEVVFGVVAGLSAAKHDVPTIVTGLVALVVGFGF